MVQVIKYTLVGLIALAILQSCGSKNNSPIIPPAPLVLSKASLDGNQAALSNTTQSQLNYDTKTNFVVRLDFNNSIDKSSVTNAVKLLENGNNPVAVNFSYERKDSSLLISPATAVPNLTLYSLTVSKSLLSVKKGGLNSDIIINLSTKIDSSNKFPLVSDDQLLDIVQQQTFKYFWDFAHPVSGLARERSNATPETVTIGGSGFGIMAIPVAINRNFISRAQGLARLQTIVNFLKTKAKRFHGVFPHWINGSTGDVIPFSAKDNGADLVETSFLIMGLLTAREFFNGAGTDETSLRTDINSIWHEVEWDWFRKGGSNSLYWHWSPTFGWDINMVVQGWNEALITYVLAASSPTHAIPKSVYDVGWANNGAMVHGQTYHGYQLPLGPTYGGPLFFEHYSFMGIDPRGLSDAYANYETQTRNHTLINYNYCIVNPKNWFGYSDKIWGLTASDIYQGYTASSPTNDKGFIAPTAALSSFPYTPVESMKALKFFYYTLGDKLFKEYGFMDAFSLHSLYYSNSFLAIDQGPIIGMIENYRSQLLWKLFTGCPEVKTGMKTVLGFSAPYL